MKEAGLFEFTGPTGTVRFKSAQCVHCGCHYPVVPGSGKLRGWCLKCNGPICGPKCVKCVPYERQIELMEGLIR